jgi:protein-tyrosine kinase
MSRIERALEKALNIRRPMTDPGRSTYSKCDPSVFDVGDAGIDPAVVNRHLVSITDPYSTAAEEYRKLRAKIMRATEANYLNTIMVTSSQAGEGKSMTAINLAVTIAQEIDHTVLLVDADLRRSSIHTYLGMKPEAGLSDVLESRAELSDVMIKTGIGKLVVLPAGNPPRNPSELISSERMRILIRELKFRYRDRYIIIDSSPLLMTADALSLCEYTDGIIFVVQADRTSMKAATQAASLLKGHNVLGTVFNDVPKHLAKNLYPYYYSSMFTETVKTGDAAGHRVDDTEKISAAMDDDFGFAEAVDMADAAESGEDLAENKSAGITDGSGSSVTADTAGTSDHGADIAENTSASRDDENNGPIPENA